MRLFLAAALSLAMASPLAFAQTAQPAPAAPPSATAVQLATRLYNDVRPDGVFAAIGGEQVQREGMGARNAAGDKASCPALQQPWKNFVQKIQPIYEGMADAQFKQGAINIYATSFTEGELRDITGFLESPSGKKWGAMSEQVNQRMLALAAQQQKAREASIRSTVMEFETSFKATLATCPAAPATAPAPKRKR